MSTLKLVNLQHQSSNTPALVLNANNLVSVTGNLNVSNNLVVTGNTIHTGTTTFTGNVTAGNLIVSGATTFTGNITGNTTFSGSVNFNTDIVPTSSFKRNRIINGNMLIDQRNAGASVTPTDGQYLTDRFVAGLTAASKFTAQQSSTAPTGFSNSLLITSSSAYSVSASDAFTVGQKIEGFNFADLMWGTANAATITLSFWVRSSLTGTFGGAITNNGDTRSYPFSCTISTANTWEQKSVTIAGDTSGTWIGSTNGIGARVWFGLGVGTTYSGTAGAWVGSAKVSVTGAVSVVGTNGATFYITGVQLEVGTKATPYEMQMYSDQLAQCQRYYQKSYEEGVAPGTNSANGIIGGVMTDSSGRGIGISYPFTMRPVSPTFTYYDRAGNVSKYSALGNGSWTDNQSTGFQILSASSRGFVMSATSSAAAVACFVHYAVSTEL